MGTTDFEKQVGKEKKDETPKISLDFYFARHKTAEDDKGLKALFEKADIYVPEAPRWDERLLQFFNRVSEGEINPDEVSGLSPNQENQLRMLYGSHKPVLLFDMPSSLDPDLEEHQQLLDKALTHFTGGEFDKAVEEFREFLKKLAEQEKERESFIESEIQKRIFENPEETPGISEKIKKGEPINILFRLGSVHTPIYQNLKRAGFNVQRSFRDMPEMFTRSAEVIRRYRFNKDVSDDTIIRAIIEFIISLHLDYIADEDDTYDADKIARGMVSGLTTEDIKTISEKLSVGQDLFDIVESLGVKIPQSKKELDVVIERHPEK